MSELCKASAPAPASAPTTDKPRPTGLLQGLGLIGLSSIEAPVLAALATEEPLLLIGPHGTAKSLMLTRIATALGLTFRHYNASLLNFDDLVGFPLPGKDGQLEYMTTPAAVWGAGGFRLVCRLSARARDRRDFGLGAGAFSAGRVCFGAVRRHASVRTR